MTTDYIKREDAVRVVKGYGKGLIGGGVTMLDVVDGIAGIIDEIRIVPKQDVEPVRKAKWVPSRYSGYLMCSACEGCLIDEGWPMIEEHKWNYCPECGARMEVDG